MKQLKLNGRLEQVERFLHHIRSHREELQRGVSSNDALQTHQIIAVAQPVLRPPKKTMALCPPL
jgi:hypothetical protein